SEMCIRGRIARDAPTLQKVMPVGAKFGINIAPEHLHSDSFKEDMHRLRDALPAHHFHIVLEITCLLYKSPSPRDFAFN
ncbi:hypothetical protein V3C21_24730, partial [Salmonella enterica subsp. enterica serovar Paratyphi B]